MIELRLDSAGIPIVPDDLVARVRSGERPKVKIITESGSVSNALRWGVAGFNVDGCRVGTTVETWPTSRSYNSETFSRPTSHGTTESTGPAPAGRFPSNASFGHSEACTADACAPGCAVAELDVQSGDRSSTRMSNPRNPKAGINRGDVSYGARGETKTEDYRDSGGASKFYNQFRYQSKAGPGERMRGCELFFWKVDRDNPLGFKRITREEWEGMDDRQRYQGSIHPTLKPIDLCRYLAKLILPPSREDGKPRRVLVPFAGTFSEVIGAFLAGWDEVVAIEMEPVYVETGKARAPIWVVAD